MSDLLFGGLPKSLGRPGIRWALVRKLILTAYQSNDYNPFIKLR